MSNTTNKINALANDICKNDYKKDNREAMDCLLLFIVRVLN